MASQSELDDPLTHLRRAIAASKPPILTTTPNPSSADDAVTEIALATHISFNNDSHPKTFAITTPTRFTLNDQAVELRSIYFAWQNKDASLPDYIAAVQHLNEELPSGAGGSVQNIAFAQKVELVSWLSGEVDTSEYIIPLDGASAAAAAENSAAIASGKTGVSVVQIGSGEGKTQKMVDARLLEIYQGERKMGDHNSVLRGTKPVVRLRLSYNTTQYSPIQNTTQYSPIQSNTIQYNPTQTHILTHPSRTSPPSAKLPPHSSAPAPPTPPPPSPQLHTHTPPRSSPTSRKSPPAASNPSS
ncbi:hypothetical protein BCR34DRAFT_258442 [Clohesyomyces aquaticus]|uniref:Uncharacterized protein n=1 Tax=Clohesyomyces aquaticus TaxID=1231657 RepID=A0A1Y1Y2Y8_9PLEO|nr:hypothetical protein BCR34DRAFT_258442 [Clohesyomyces aquaticus]